MSKDHTTIKELAKAAKKAGLIDVDLRKPLTKYAKTKIRKLQKNPQTAPILWDFTNRVQNPKLYNAFRKAELSGTDMEASRARAAYEAGTLHDYSNHTFIKKIRGEKEAAIFRKNKYFVYNNHVYLRAPSPASKISFQRSINKRTGAYTVTVRQHHRGELIVRKTPLTLERIDIFDRLNEIIELEEAGIQPVTDWSVQIGPHQPFKRLRSAKDLLHYLENVFTPKDENTDREDLFPIMTEVDSSLYLEHLANAAARDEDPTRNTRTYKPASKRRLTKRQRIKGR